MQKKISPTLNWNLKKSTSFSECKIYRRHFFRTIMANTNHVEASIKSCFIVASAHLIFLPHATFTAYHHYDWIFIVCVDFCVTDCVFVWRNDYLRRTICKIDLVFITDAHTLAKIINTHGTDTFHIYMEKRLSTFFKCHREYKRSDSDNSKHTHTKK